MTPAPVALEDHTAGDTWPGIPTIGPIVISINGATAVAPTYPLASARIHLTREGSPLPAIKIGCAADDDAPLIIISGADWQMSVPRVSHTIFPRLPGLYTGQLETTDTQGTVLTTHSLSLRITRDETV